MTKSPKAEFRPPLARYTPCKMETESAIDRLLGMAPAQDGSVPACLRIDVYIADRDDIIPVPSNVGLYVEEGDSVSWKTSRQMHPEIRALFIEALVEINEDDGIAHSLRSYPLPWNDPWFLEYVENRYLSILFFGEGIGAVIQEYLPSWPNLADGESSQCFAADASAETRSEIMSLFVPDEPQSNHRDLALREQIKQKYDRIGKVFDRHCDYGIDVDLMAIDMTDCI